jgi:molybdopterin/thiamine biosynthesis adenylyltransferase
MMTREENERYSRQILLEEIGIEGQDRLSRSRVLIIGAGGLGSPAALYLAAAGVGTIIIADGDLVELSNLQRQVLHGTGDIGRPKVDSARERMLAINPGVRVVARGEFVTEENIRGMVEGSDFVIDGTDNFNAKYLINDTCLLLGVPFSHGGVLRFRGQTITVKPGESPCFRCIFPDPPADDVAAACSRDGILGFLPGVIGAIQATEAVKCLLGIGELLTGRLLTYDAMRMMFREIAIPENPLCPACAPELQA